MADTNLDIILRLKDEMSAQIQKAKSSLSSISAQMDTLSDNAQRANKELKTQSADITKLQTGLSKVAAGASAVALATGGLTLAFAKQANELEQNTIAFTTMLGSAEMARAMIKEMQELAKTTPFTMPEVIEGAKMLTAYGTAAGDVRKELSMLGNVSAGLKIPLNDLVYLYGTLQVQGRAFARDLTQFAGRGIPIYDELAKVMGVSKNEIRGMVEEGKVGFPEVQKAFQNMTGEGGKFYNLMLEQSKSLGGMWSNFTDSIGIMAAEIGMAMMPALKAMLKVILNITSALSSFVKAHPFLTQVLGTVLLLTTAAAAATAAYAIFAKTVLSLVVPSLTGMGAQLAIINTQMLALLGTAAIFAIQFAAVGVAVFAVVAVVKTYWDEIVAITTSTFNNIKSAILGTWEAIKTGTLTALSIVVNTISWFWNTFDTAILGITGLILGLYIPTLVKMGAETVATLTMMTIRWVAETSKWLVASTKSLVATTVLFAKETGKWIAQMVVTSSKVIAQWVLMAVGATVEATKMAAAWVIAMGPIAWVTGAIVGLTGVIIANWDKVKSYTAEVWGSIPSAITAPLAAAWETIKSWLNNILGGFDKFGKWIEKLSGGTIKLSDITKKVTGTISDVWQTAKGMVKGSVDQITASLGGGSGGGGMTGALGDAGSAAKDAGKDFSKFAEDIKKRAEDITKKISGIRQSMADLKKETEEANKSNRMNLAEAYVEAEQKIKELKQERRDIEAELRDEESEEQRKSLQKQLKEVEDSLQQEAQALESVSSYKSEISKELSEARKLAAMTELERAAYYYDLEKKKIAELHNEKLAKLKEELAEVDKQRNEMVRMVAEKNEELKKMYGEDTGFFRKELGEQVSAIEETGRQMVDVYNQIAAAKANALGGNPRTVTFKSPAKLPKREFGGQVNAGDPVWAGERGPEMFVPQRSGYLLPNKSSGSGGTTVVINVAGSIATEREIAEKLMDVFTREMKLSNQIT